MARSVLGSATLKFADSFVLTRRFFSTRLIEAGTFEKVRSPALAYDSGQLFIHRVLGYRGVLLFSWSAKIYDKDAQNRFKLDGKQKKTTSSLFFPSDTIPLSRFWYQALIDERDWPYIRFQIGSLAHLGVDNSQREYAGLDYVDHDDVIPYNIRDVNSLISHDMLESFLRKTFDSDGILRLQPTDVLRVWTDENLGWLELSSVYRETTDDIRVTVVPFYMGRSEDNEHAFYWWRYCTRLENLNKEVGCILREREWKIISCTGKVDTIKGRGILSTIACGFIAFFKEPELSRLARAFQYSSRVSLSAPSGQMWGSFKMERESGRLFHVKVPPFILMSQSSANPQPPDTKS